MEGQVKQENSSSERNYMSQVNSDSAVIYRLNPDEVVLRIESYLRGGYDREYYDDALGEVRTRFVKTGDKVLNEKGVQSVMASVKSVLNASVVQGNFDEARFVKYCEELHDRLAFNLMLNKDKWGVLDNGTYHNVVGNIMSTVYPFMSRLVDNKERDGLNVIIKESINTVTGKGKSLLGFGGR